ncbi:MAG TPA: NAD-dependent epimerase/dehydratase family protein [Thermoleophilaceae bacterium]|jgi:nucleoside-diphosphate-sugar epimerase
MKVVVTGATGNVGTSLLQALVDEPRVNEVVGIARRVPRRLWPKTSWVAADVTRDDLVPLFRGADAVVHLAWLIQPSRDQAALRATNVDGSRRVFQAAGEAGAGALVYASSVGAYSPGPKDRLVDEGWPTEGIRSSFYSRHKAEVERELDLFERAFPQVRTVRLRPGLIFKREAASEIRRYFAGPFLPGTVLRRSLIPIVPDVDGLRFQAVHSHDVGAAYRLAVTGDARGAFNVAADPVLDPAELADLLGARRVRLSPRVLRIGADLTWRMRLQPTPPGWVDMALNVPLLDSSRARQELGWTPRRSSREALLDLLDGLREGDGVDTPPLSPSAGGPLRVREVLTGVGGRN